MTKNLNSWSRVPKYELAGKKIQSYPTRFYVYTLTGLLHFLCMSINILIVCFYWTLPPTLADLREMLCRKLRMQNKKADRSTSGLPFGNRVLILGGSRSGNSAWVCLGFSNAVNKKHDLACAELLDIRDPRFNLVMKILSWNGCIKLWFSSTYIEYGN